MLSNKVVIIFCLSVTRCVVVLRCSRRSWRVFSGIVGSGSGGGVGCVSFSNNSAVLCWISWRISGL